jgi:hypothetical protein
MGVLPVDKSRESPATVVRFYGGAGSRQRIPGDPGANSLHPIGCTAPQRLYQAPRPAVGFPRGGTAYRSECGHKFSLSLCDGGYGKLAEG